ncbi:MAG TPA: TlpA disulfide reductase family protein [Salinivirgaceae bacterium]|nr:TlpA disulfide reductase family protein [Salinivirgaceae bacterium]
MIIKWFTVLLPAIILIYGCSNRGNDNANFRVEAKIVGVSGSQVFFMVEDPNRPDGFWIDSLKATDDIVIFEGTIDTVRSAAIVVDNNELMKPTKQGPKTLMPVQFFVEPGKTVKVEGEISSLHLSRLSGSLMNDQMDSLILFIGDKQRRFDLIVDQYRVAELEGIVDNQMKDSVRESYISLIEKHAEFVSKHPDWDLSPYIIKFYLSQYLEPNRLKELFDNLTARAKKTFYGRLLEEEFKSSPATTSLNELAPEFRLFDKDRNVVMLSDYKGRYLLLVFWGSWCKPCRDSHPHLVSALKEYRAKGLQVLGIAADQDRAAWLQAISDDRLDWQQVNALEQTEIDVLKLYNIKVFPTKILIDPQGIMMARFIGDDPNLYSLLKQIYQ